MYYSSYNFAVRLLNFLQVHEYALLSRIRTQNVFSPCNVAPRGGGWRGWWNSGEVAHARCRERALRPPRARFRGLLGLGRQPESGAPAAGGDGRREPGGGAVAAWLRAGEARVVQGQGLEASLGCVSALEEHVDDDGVPGRAARAS
jgi:hypothetical protein